MKKVILEGSELVIIPVIHGLVGEEKKVQNALKNVKPDCIALGIPPEDIDIMKKIEGDEEFEMSLQHQYYLKHLSNYGEISLPPLDIKLAIDFSSNNDIPIMAIDINDDEYSELLTKNVSIFAIVKHSRKIKKIAKKKFKARNAEEFVFEWDKELSSIKPFRKIEEMREERNMKNLVSLCKQYKKILAIIPLEKFRGIIERLERYKR